MFNVYDDVATGINFDKKINAFWQMHATWFFLKNKANIEFSGRSSELTKINGKYKNKDFVGTSDFIKIFITIIINKGTIANSWQLEIQNERHENLPARSDIPHEL